jgi:hypothetical protein
VNQGTGTLLEVNACWEGDATSTREFLENGQGLVEELTLARHSDPPSTVEVSVGQVAWHPALLGEGLAVRFKRLGITFKVSKALGALVVD